MKKDPNTNFVKTRFKRTKNMNFYVEIFSCGLYLISTVSTILLLCYAITRYCTDERCGIYSGFTTASIVMIAMGICIYCSLVTLEKILVLTLHNREFFFEYPVIIHTCQYFSYLFSLSWVNAVFIQSTKNKLTLNPPNKNRNRKDYGFRYSLFRKWLLYTILFPIFVCTFAILTFIRGENANMIWSETFYFELTLHVFSGGMCTMNVLLLSTITWIMEKSRRSVRSFPPQSTWKRFKGRFKAIIKCGVVMFAMWIIDFSGWCIHSFGEDNKNAILSVFEDILNLIYSTQGIILFCVVFIYRSTQDPNPVILALEKFKLQHDGTR